MLKCVHYHWYSKIACAHRPTKHYAPLQFNDQENKYVLDK